MVFGKSEKNTEVAGINLRTTSNIEYKRFKQSVRIEVCSFTFDWDQNGFFGRNLEKFNINSKQGTINPIKYIREFEENFNGLVEQDYKEITRKNINTFIKDVDILLGLYYLNPSVNSSTSLLCDKICNFTVNVRDNCYFPKWYKPKFEKLNFENTKNVAGINGEMILGLGNNNEHTYKIKYSFFVNSHKETQLSWKVFKWYGSGGWILMLNDSDPNDIFNLIEIYSKDTFGIPEHDKIIKYCLDAIAIFDNHSIRGFDGDK